MSDNAAFTLRRADDLLQPEASAKAGARSYALVAADLFGKARTWHSDSLKSNGKSSLLTEEASVNIYPIMLRVSVTRGTNALTVKISRKDNSAENFKRANKILASESEPVHIWDFSGRTTFILMNEWNRMPQDPRSSDQEMPLEIQFYDISEPPANGAAGRKDELALTMGSSALSNGGIMDMDLDSSGGIYLVRKLWAIDGTSFSPRQFKAKLARFAPQFSGFNQHDSQELLAFLLDGLHEDLNRVKCKPYAEAKDSDGRPDEEVADEYWGNHLARNDSIIVDTCQGQYKSTLVCPLCKKVSITFDPFMYLSLPLPSTTMRTMTVTVFSTDGSIGPSPYTVSIPKSGDFKTLINALSNACSLRDDERLLVAEVYNSSLIRYLEDPSDDISLIRDGDKLVAYRLPKDSEGAAVVVFKSERMESSISSFGRKSWKNFGTPLVSNLPDTIDGRTIYNLLLKALTPFREPKDDVLDADQITGKSSPVNETSDIDMSSDAAECSSMNTNAGEDDMTTEGGMLFFLNTERFPNQRMKIEMDQTITLSNLQKRLIVSVSWQDNGLKQYNLDSLDSLPEVYKTVLFTRRPQETCSLYACLEAFIKEEPLGPEDMWYCPGCKEHRQASKKLDLWRLPEILIIHLKRFSYSRYTKNKLDTYVDFPIHDLDLSSYIRDRSGQMSNHYQLYAVSNHYGSMGGGHYTAYVYNDGKKKWYDFDDRCVSGLENEDSIKTSAAYVLFYRREPTWKGSRGGDSFQHPDLKAEEKLITADIDRNAGWLLACILVTGAHARTNVGGYVCLNNVHPACSWEASAPRIFRLVTELSSLIAKSIELAAAELNRPELLGKRPHLGSTLMVAMASKVASAVGLTASVANILLSGWPKGGSNRRLTEIVHSHHLREKTLFCSSFSPIPSPRYRIHSIFHVSQLKPYTPDYTLVFSKLPRTPDLTATPVEPIAILERILVKKGNSSVVQVKVQCSSPAADLASWEGNSVLRHRYPMARFWEEDARAQGEANVTPDTVLSADL
ncbi:Ubiquitin carboxyl-terminal hydrolase 8 [Triticum urartu]|uniref:ubiquitinyl hydrolase 1 n=1 Tax=Triticum urartu TaxID=4572 RepID=M7ZX23_TRIUA|nr:Ubiquitin carboxyl-terminal hydrolase 8 [Triticum urartu]